MVGPSSSPSMSKGKQLAVSSEESDVDRSSGLKGILLNLRGGLPTQSNLHGNNCPGRLQSIGQGVKVNDEHSAIIESQFLYSNSKTTILTSMAGIPKEVARQFEEQAWVQRKQLEMIRAQEEYIDALKQMLSKLLKKKKEIEG